MKFKLLLLSFLLLTLLTSPQAKEPPVVQGNISLNLPLTLFPVDTGSHRYTWFPLPEMGFSIQPDLKFPDVRVSFPITFRTLTPFLDEYASINDLTVGTYLHFSEKHHLGMDYRFLLGNLYPVPGEFSAHGFILDIGFPIKKIKVQGFKFELLASSEVKFKSNSMLHNKYETSILFFSPYWAFQLPEGEVIATLRTTITGQLTGVNTSSGGSYKGKPDYISILTLEYVFP